MSYVEPSLIPARLLSAAQEYAAAHTAGGLRGTTEQPHPPFPGDDNPMLVYLVEGAEAMLRAGSDPADVILQAVVHAWFEGNIEGREQQAQAAQQ